MNTKTYLRLLSMIAALCLGTDAFAVLTPIFTVKSVSGTVVAQFPGATSFAPVSAGEKLPLGVTIRTGKQSDALVSLLPGFCIKIDGNSVVTISSVHYEDTTPPKRSVLVDLHSGRLVAILERYFPGRTSFFVQTGEMEGGNVDAKDKSVALGGAWDAGSCGAVVVTADSGYSRVSQVVGTGTWTESNGDTSQIAAGNVVVDNNGNVSGASPIDGNGAAMGDQVYANAAIRDAVGSGLVDPAGCPGFSQFPIQSPADTVLGLPLNAANAGASTSTRTKPQVSSSPTPTSTPAPTPAPTPPPVISPSSLPEPSPSHLSE
jgi:hypothetical protein